MPDRVPRTTGYSSSLSVAHGGNFDTASPATCSWLPHFKKKIVVDLQCGVSFRCITIWFSIDTYIFFYRFFPLWASQMAFVVKNPPANAGDPCLIPGLGRSPGAGHGNPLQYSCLENPLDRGVWRATVHRVAESNTTDRLLQNNGYSSLHYTVGPCWLSILYIGVCIC